MAEKLAPNTSVDSYIACRNCQKRVYVLYRVAVPGRPDVFTHRLWPCYEGGWVEPPDATGTMKCPTCKDNLVRLDPKKDPTKEKI